MGPVIDLNAYHFADKAAYITIERGTRSSAPELNLKLWDNFNKPGAKSTILTKETTNLNEIHWADRADAIEFTTST